MKLSIIIALYNTEKYIEKCIRSLYSRKGLSIEQFEVIVINDGSSDKGPNLVEQLQKEYSNIILINKENGGQSSARNIGFNVAGGAYLFCLDSDDFLNADNLKKALMYAENKNLDMLPIFFQIFDENYNNIKEKNDYYPIFEEVITGGTFLNKFTVSGSMWRYFYKSSLIKQHNLFLTEGIYHEDEEFVVKYLSYAERISYQRHVVYNHLVRSDSTVNKKNKEHRIKLLNDLLTVIISLNQHRYLFNKKSETYIGISKKVEQLSVSLFLRMKSDKLKYNETKHFVNRLKDKKLYPLRIEKLGFKFKFVSFLFNLAFFNKFYFK